MNPLPKLRKLFCLAFLCLAGAGSVLLTGCASTDPENRAERPWNSPTGWEHGLPGGMVPGVR
jgi:hypothetical protein